MAVVVTAPPAASALGGAAIASAYFSDAYSTPLKSTDLGIVQIYAALFGHTPRSMKLLLIARNWDVQRHRPRQCLFSTVRS